MRKTIDVLVLALLLLGPAVLLSEIDSNPEDQPTDPEPRTEISHRTDNDSPRSDYFF